MSRIKESVTIIGAKGTKDIKALIDTGASTTHIREDLADEVGAIKVPINGTTELGDGTEIPTTRGFAGITINGCTVGVMGKLAKKLSRELIIGADFLQNVNAKVDLENDKLIIKCPPKKHFLV